VVFVLAVVFVNVGGFVFVFGEGHGTFVLRGADNLGDARKSEYVKEYIGWLEEYTGADFDVDKDGRVRIVKEPKEPKIKPLYDKIKKIIESGKRVEILLNKSHPGVWFDAFKGNGKQVQDLADLEALPNPGEIPNAWDRAQQIAHTLNEALYAAEHGAGYMDSHRKGGIRSENIIRVYLDCIGKRVLDGHTWQILNETHWAKHWFGPPDKEGNKVEVYREIFRVSNCDIVKDKNGKPIIVRVREPANPKKVKDPQANVTLVFLGRVVYVAEPVFNAWCGEVENFQLVRYEVIEVVEGNYTRGFIDVYHALIIGSGDCDLKECRLTPSKFYNGSMLIVRAVFTGSRYECDTPTVQVPVTPTTTTVTVTTVTTSTVTSTTTIVKPTTVTQVQTTSMTITSTLVETSTITKTTTVTATETVTEVTPTTISETEGARLPIPLLKDINTLLLIIVLVLLIIVLVTRRR